MRLARLPLRPLERTSGGRFGRARGSPISLSPPIAFYPRSFSCLCPGSRLPRPPPADARMNTGYSAAVRPSRGWSPLPSLTAPSKGQPEASPRRPDQQQFITGRVLGHLRRHCGGEMTGAPSSCLGVPRPGGQTALLADGPDRRPHRPALTSAPTKKGAADESPQRLFARQAGPSTPPPSGGRRGP